MQPACREYTAFLASLHARPYAVQAAAFWAMEAVYNQAWTRVGEGLADEKYREFVERWGRGGAGEAAVCWRARVCAAAGLLGLVAGLTGRGWPLFLGVSRMAPCSCFQGLSWLQAPQSKSVRLRAHPTNRAPQNTTPQKVGQRGL
jgi:hypothetical protein